VIIIQEDPTIPRRIPELRKQALDELREDELVTPKFQTIEKSNTRMNTFGSKRKE
jgi:hypothetical protein